MLKTVLLLLLLLTSSFTSLAAEQQGRVSWVYDGDTIEVDKIGKVRLLGIDTPEYQDSQRDNFYLKRFDIPRKQLRKISKAAKHFNITAAKGKIVTLQSDKTRYDKYGRLLAYVYLPDGRELNILLLEQGLATVFRRFNFAHKKTFLQAEHQAQQAKIGLWAE